MIVERSEDIRLLKLKRVAFILDCSLRQVQTLCSSGVLKRVVIGARSARVTRESLEELIGRARHKSGGAR